MITRPPYRLIPSHQRPTMSPLPIWMPDSSWFNTFRPLPAVLPTLSSLSNWGLDYSGTNVPRPTPAVVNITNYGHDIQHVSLDHTLDIVASSPADAAPQCIFRIILFSFLAVVVFICALLCYKLIRDRRRRNRRQEILAQPVIESPNLHNADLPPPYSAYFLPEYGHC
ncbi:uncharacterized protein LOC142980713 [Anticarsia gemmatalis]|uniref:uncharacterized protein LOC142980713 n=1 Tax=Anticarsia gemmatalis TaxID=129554 RepID=UPI003F7638CB